MADNTMQPSSVPVKSFLQSAGADRQIEALQLIGMMRDISGEPPVMWGPSIVGFGTMHYKYESGREGDVPRLAFSPRKTAIMIYFTEGFDPYSEHLIKLGVYKASVSCLYLNKLSDVNIDVLRSMLELSFQQSEQPASKATVVDEYVASIPQVARPVFNQLRRVVRETLPSAQEVFTYGIIGYKVDNKRARVFISGWRDHVAMYPAPKDPALAPFVKPYVRGKGSLWFPLDKPLPVAVVKRIIKALL